MIDESRLQCYLRYVTQACRKDTKDELKLAPDFIYVADSAMYDSCVNHNLPIRWICRVPERIKMAQDLVQTPEADIAWHALDQGYRIACYNKRYKEIDQRWLLVYSEQAYVRECKTLEKRIEKERLAHEKILTKLSNQIFQASTALKQAKKGLKYHMVEGEVNPIWGHQGRGRPQKGSQKVIIGYAIHPTV